MAQVEHVEGHQPPAGAPPAGEVLFHRVAAGESPHPHVVEVGAERGLELVTAEQHEMEGVLEVGRRVGRDHEGGATGLDHARQLRDVGFRRGEVLHEM